MTTERPAEPNPPADVVHPLHLGRPTRTVALRAGTFRAIIQAALCYVAKTEQRPILCAVHISLLRSSRVTFSATDGCAR